MKHLILCVFLLFSAGLFAQKKDKNLPKGNEEFNDKKFAEAEADYRISQFQNPQRATASYNLGNAIYRQKQPSEAKHSYLEAIENAKGKKQKHKAYHNLGNVLMTEKNYQGAVEAYKNALRNNPSDEETRYNYALAKQKLKENPPKKDDKNKDKDKDQNKDQQPKDNKDQNKDQQDKNQDKNQDKKDDPKNPDKKEGKGDEDKQPQKPQPSGASKQRMENLLDALNNEEKKIQDKVKGREVKGRPTQNEKDW
ncbi:MULTISPECIES: tetratricopeptide repeat protein [Flavobacterium]|uniref:tetratricopeptide repeat protein n=1 Tax=Flavobacterium TaxID=237 RepID=UPI001FCCA802|nr:MULTISPECIES: tetratricopeptide repeat protein [Flavobacterium]UOK43066.1 tetratricopeptide repeat protein [Flavobacterium enshiense]